MFFYLILPVLVLTVLAALFRIIPYFRSKKSEKRKKRLGDTR